MLSIPRGPLMVGVQGHFLQEDEKELLSHPNIGGVILFSRNFESTTQLTELTHEIHQLRFPQLLIAVDHEGGRVQRFKDGFSELPAVGLFGDYYNHSPVDALAYANISGELMALELKACGVDISFAPVLDIDDGQSDILATRGFHQQPEHIAILADAYINGMRNASMEAVAKHFPGHGSVKLDTHLGEVIDLRPLDDIITHDLIPFQRMIDKGLESVMSAHIIYPEVDPLPASFSAIWMHDILRQKLNFTGIIFSDDLGMAAAKAFGDALIGTEEALNSGCDIILLCNDFAESADVTLNLSRKVSPLLSTRLSVFTKPLNYDKMTLNKRQVNLQKELEKYRSLTIS